MARPTHLGPYSMPDGYPQPIPLPEFKKLAAHFPLLDRTGRDPDPPLDRDGPVKYTDNTFEKGFYNCFAWVLGYSDRGVEPPRGAPEFTTYFQNLGLIPCNEADASIDAYIFLGTVTHASRRNPNPAFSLQANPPMHPWESKYNWRGARFTHNREGLDQKEYGERTLFFRLPPPAAREPMAQTVSVPSADTSDSPMKESVLPQTLPGISNVDTALTTNFPMLVQKFNQLYAAWTALWPDKLSQSSWSSVVAEGPEFDALVGMGMNILPFVVDKLGVRENVPSIHLYNKVQPDASKKVDPRNFARACVPDYQAKDIRNLYLAFITTFDKAADAWVSYLKSLPSSSHDQCVGSAYTGLIQLGKTSVPLVMVRYANDHSGWWHELLFELVTGNKPAPVATGQREELWTGWKAWFQGGAAVPTATALRPSA